MNYLKNNAKGYKTKQAVVFSRNEIERFLQINDPKLEQMKLIFLIGIFGACRATELTNLTVHDVQVDQACTININIRDSKNGPRWFVLPRSDTPWDIYPVYNRLIQMRTNVTSDRLFMKINENGLMVNNPIGINTILKIPEKIATILGLSEPEKYTSHAIRRTGATILSNTGVDPIRLMRYGNWKNISCAEGYIGDSMKEKMDIAKIIIGNNTQEPVQSIQQQQSIQQHQPTQQQQPCSIFYNCYFLFYFFFKY